MAIKRSSRAGALILSVATAGCASLPDVTYNYYLRKYKTTVTITQSVDCNHDKTALVVFNTPSVSTVYPADYSREISIQIKKLDSSFGDSNFQLSLTEDGRLDGVDQSTTGQAAGIVKSAISLAVAGAAIGGSAGTKADYAMECQFIADSGGGKPLSITYKLDLTDLSQGTLANIEPTPDYKDYVKALPHLSSLKVEVKNVIDLDAPAVVTGAPTVPPYTKPASKGPSTDHVDLWLQKMKSVTLELSYQGSVFGTSTVIVPGDSFALSIPDGQPFGTQSFKLKLAESGAVTMIDFGKGNGTSAALDSATGVLNAAAPKTTAEQTSDLKEQADLIAARTRLSDCQSSPSTCK